MFLGDASYAHQNNSGVEFICKIEFIVLIVAAIVDADTLQPMEKIQDRALAAIAARVGNTRLIDNRELRHVDKD